MQTLPEYLRAYPALSHTKLAEKIVSDKTSQFSLRTLRRMISQARQHPQPPATMTHQPTEYNKFYHYQADVDTYLLFLPGERPFCLKGETVRDLKRAYSDWDGQPATINEVCRRFTMIQNPLPMKIFCVDRTRS